MRGGTDLRVAPAAALAWAAGAVATGVTSRVAALVTAGALAAGALAVVAGVRRRRRRRPVTSPAASTEAPAAAPTAAGTALGTLALALLAVAAVGASGTVHLAQREAATTLLRQAVAVEGSVVGDPRPLRFHGTRVRVAPRTVVLADGRRTALPPVELLVRGGPGWADVDHGATVRLAGPVTVLAGERAVVEVRAGPPDVLAPPRGVAAAVGVLRDGLVASVERLPPDSRGLVPGTAVGDTRAMPADLAQAMRDTGLTHVIAVSGAHFSVVLAALLGLGAAMRLPAGARAAATLVGVVGFALLVHPGPAVLRAAVMGGIAVLGLVLGRPSRAVPALCWAVVGLVCWDPWTARDVGFHLSVAATAAIVLLAPRLAQRLPGPHAVRTAVAVPAAAQAACGPVLVLLDPVLPVYAVPANLLAAPALLPGTLGGVLATLARPVAPWLADACLHVADGAARWLAGVARGLAALPLARVPWPAGAGGAWLLAVVTAGVLVVVLRRPVREP